MTSKRRLRERRRNRSATGVPCESGRRQSRRDARSLVEQINAPLRKPSHEEQLAWFGLPPDYAARIEGIRARVPDHLASLIASRNGVH